MKGVSCVDQLSSVHPVTNVHTVAQNLPVWARLNQCWKSWAALGASSKVIRILNEGYTLPFWNRPNLTRSPMIKSGSVYPIKNSYLMEALYALIQKIVNNQTSLAFFNRFFLVPKPNIKLRHICTHRWILWI